MKTLTLHEARILEEIEFHAKAVVADRNAVNNWGKEYRAEVMMVGIRWLSIQCLEDALTRLAIVREHGKEV